MINAGLSVYNDDGYLQIDDTYYCPSFLYKAVVSATMRPPFLENYQGGEWYFADIVSYGAVPPYLALRSSTPCGIIGSTKNGNQIISRVIVRGSYNAGPSFIYYAFGPPTYTTGIHGAGIEVYNERGEPVFTSETPLMRLFRPTFELIDRGTWNREYYKVTNATPGHTYAWIHYPQFEWYGNNEIWTDMTEHYNEWFGGLFTNEDTTAGVYYFGSETIYASGGEGFARGAPDSGTDPLDRWSYGQGQYPLLVDVTGL